LASAGWTIPLWADPRIVHRLRDAPGNLDRAFVRHYTGQGATNLRALWKDLLASRGLRHWRALLREAIASYEDKRYAIVIPALLCVVEGSISAADGALRRRSRPRESATRKRDTTPAGMRRVIWVSIEAFLQPIFGDAPFHAERPAGLNRHWVLHGRDTTAWGKRRECIRLFHALDTLAATVDRIR
jgi:hypothetical protein